MKNKGMIILFLIGLSILTVFMCNHYVFSETYQHSDATVAVKPLSVPRTIMIKLIRRQRRMVVVKNQRNRRMTLVRLLMKKPRHKWWLWLRISCLIPG